MFTSFSRKIKINCKKICQHIFFNNVKKNKAKIERQALLVINFEKNCWLSFNIEL